MNRHCKILYVSPDALMVFLNDWQRCTHIRLPRLNLPGACVEDVFFDNSRRQFGFVLSHPEWEEVEHGAELPVIEVAIEEVTIPKDTEAKA